MSYPYYPAESNIILNNRKRPGEKRFIKFPGLYLAGVLSAHDYLREIERKSDVRLEMLYQLSEGVYHGKEYIKGKVVRNDAILSDGSEGLEGEKRMRIKYDRVMFQPMTSGRFLPLLPPADLKRY